MKIVDVVKTFIDKIRGHHMAKDSIAIGIAQIFSIVIGILLGVVIARSLSMEDMGKYQLVLSYIAIANIIALPGMNPIIAKGILQGYDPIFYAAVKRSLLATTCFSLLFLVIGGAIYIFNIARWPGSVLMIIAAFLPMLGVEKYESFFKGKRDFQLSRKIAVAGALLNFLVVGVVAWVTKNFLAIIAVVFLCRMVVNIFCLWIIRKKLDPQARSANEEGPLLKQGWGMSALSVFNMLVGQLDRIILGTISPETLAIYHIGSIFPRRIKDNVKIFLVVPVTHWAKASSEEYLEGIKKHWLKFVLLGVGLSAAVWILAPILIPFLYGGQYSESVRVAQLVSLILPVIFVGNVIMNKDIYHGDTRYYKKMTVGVQVFYVGMLLVLVPRFGIYGVVASFVARAYMQNLVFPVIYLRRHLRAGF